VDINKVKLLYSLLGSSPPTIRGDWIVGNCAFAKFRHSSGKDSNPSFGIKLEASGVPRFHCFSCNSSGDILDLAMELSTLYKGVKTTLPLKGIMELCTGAVDDVVLTESSVPDYTLAVKTPKIDYDFPEWWLDRFSKVLESELACAYLETREITVAVAEELDLRWDDSQRRVCFPYRNLEGLLVGMNGRAISNTAKLRYFQYSYESNTNVHVWYGEDTMNLDTPLVVTESVFDAASIKRVYSNVVAAFSCSFSKEKALKLGDALEIITLFDTGKGGDIARANMKKYLPKVVTHQLIPSADDAGDMTEDAVRDMLEPYLKLKD